MKARIWQVDQKYEMLNALKEWGVDTEDGLNRMMGDCKLYFTLLAEYRDTISIEPLATQIRAGDVKAAFETAHMMKGVLGNLSIIPLYTIICGITEVLRGGVCTGLDAQLAEYSVLSEEFRRILIPLTPSVV